MKKKMPPSRDSVDLSGDPLLASLQGQSADFAGRGVVVTGGAAGIGRAIAVAFALAGARVIVFDVNVEKGEELQTLLRKLSPQSQFLRTDLSDPAAVKRAEDVFRGPDAIDILINNAATTGRLGPFPQAEQSDWESVFRVNLMAPFQLSHAFAKGLIANQKKGAIVNVHTIQTLVPVPNYTAYVTSKGGMDAMTLAMAVDLAPYGIRVNGVRVGSVLTENYLTVLPPALKQKVDQGMDATELLDARAATLLNRMGRPADIAKVVLFLASDAADFVTGTIVKADGGRSISRKVEPLL